MECMTSLGSLLRCCLQCLGILRELGVKDEIQKQISKYSLQRDLNSHWRVPKPAHAKQRLKLMCSRHGALKGTLCDTCLFLYPLSPSKGGRGGLSKGRFVAVHLYVYGPLGAKKKQGSGRSPEILTPYCHAQGISATT